MESRTGGQDVIYKAIKQRVRRTCHQCQTLFPGISTVCESCGHIRCKSCPREPYASPPSILKTGLLLTKDTYSAKLDKYPDGYPGDAESPIERPPRVWKKPRMRVRYFCHKCDTFYVPGENICATCGEEKGPNSRRDPYVFFPF
jgi:RNA polymerase subunit RPABC4/transcription elongation factor Spt4